MTVGDGPAFARAHDDPGTGLHSILVLDDCQADREILATILRHAGYKVLETSTGEEALELVRAHRPSLIVSDILMPSMNGYEFVQRLRSQPEIAATQVVFCTASYDEREVRELAAACGVVRVLPKPWEPELGLKTVAELVGRPEPVVAAAEDFDAEHVRVLSDKLVEKVTDLEKAKDALRLAGSIVDSSHDGIFATSPDGAILSWNRAAERIYGYAAEEITGQPATLLLPPDRADEPHAASAILSRGEKLESFETVHVAKDGRHLSVAVTISPMHDARGAAAGFSTIVRDITEQKQLEDQLRQSQKMEEIGQLSGGVAHDFNNMLAAITGFAELLLSPAAEVGERERAQIEQIKTAGERAAVLTGQLLAFSRRQVLQPRALDLNEVVSEIELMLRRLIGEDIEFVTSLAPELACISADATQLGQVIMNLAVNARDAMPQGGRLVIETTNVALQEPHASPQVTVPAGAYVMLAVSDTGVGMDAETAERLFEPFFTTKEEGKGTGLGLSTVYGIVKQSGGYVLADSKLGQGTTFTVYLPQVEEPAGVEAAPSAEAQSIGSGTGTVLLVEDGEIARTAIEAMLAAAGYDVVTAQDGEEALAYATEHGHELDVVMTDVVMPKMSGTELAEALRERWPALPILYTSGYVADGLLRHGVLAEASFIQKPFSLEALQRKLREIARPTGAAPAA